MRWKVGLAAVGGAAVLGVPAADAQAPPAKSVTTIGVGSASVKPKDRKDNASIKEAVDAADASARPKAIAAARERATELAQAAGLTLGGITSVSEASNFPYYGPFGVPYALQGRSAPASSAARSAARTSSATATVACTAYSASATASAASRRPSTCR